MKSTHSKALIGITTCLLLAVGVLAGAKLSESGNAGIANARDHFSNFDMCARTLSVYRELLTDANP